MNKQIVFCLMLGFTTSSLHADEQAANYTTPPSGEETTGFFSGMVLGGLAGGPPGVVVGAALGALMGDGWHAKRRVSDLQADLYESRLELAMLQERNEILQQEYQLARGGLDSTRINSAQLIPAGLIQSAASNCCDNTVLSLHFRSGSSVIESHYEEQLTSMAKLTQHMSSVSVEITGYADRNGDAEKNLSLSRQRSEAVKTFLGELGISDSSITTVAYGETKPVQSRQDLETDFFDRRVIVRLRDGGHQMLTQTPDGE